LVLAKGKHFFAICMNDAWEAAPDSNQKRFKKIKTKVELSSLQGC